eukprot:TRINITY_DN4883_c0_g1_i1.p1 TRINITY_DN4883_c0_g1~~TRINITY_DN4883_c0_g1_i1.p1  ORF type:complete len:363 (+),score=47.55 TRINITY_DN4883_c0_g1_i1:65-1153(+)
MSLRDEKHAELKEVKDGKEGDETTENDALKPSTNHVPSKEHKRYPLVTAFAFNNTTKVGTYSCAKCILYFFALFMAYNLSSASNTLIQCVSRTYGGVSVCVATNSTWDCVDFTTTTCSNACRGKGDASYCQVEIDLADGVKPRVMCLNQLMFDGVCVDRSSCPPTNKAAMSSAINLIALCALFSLILEAINAVLLFQFAEYTAEDYESATGYVARGTLFIAKSAPLATMGVHFVFLAIIGYSWLVFDREGVACINALTTQLKVNDFIPRTRLFLIVMGLFWIILTVVGGYIRFHFRVNPYLYYAPQETPRVVFGIDMDCPGARRFKPDPGTCGMCLRKCADKCVVCGECCYEFAQRRQFIGP